LPQKAAIRTPDSSQQKSKFTPAEQQVYRLPLQIVKPLIEQLFEYRLRPTQPFPIARRALRIFRQN
jgi:hypothetical protein